jgi:ribonuclease HI
MNKEQADNPEIKVFTDGSGLNSQVGAAAVLYHRGNPRPQRVLRLHLGSLLKHVSYKDEAVGLLLGVWMLQNKHIASILPILIYTDSQALINRIMNTSAKPAQYLTNKILFLFWIINLCNVAPDRKCFSLKQISGHSGVAGNKKADEEAKLAALGSSSPANTLPPILCTTLSTSTTTLKQQHACLTASS